MTGTGDIRLKGGTLRLAAAVLAGLVTLLVGGLAGLTLQTSAITALGVFAAAWLVWIWVRRLYLRLFRPTT